MTGEGELSVSRAPRRGRPTHRGGEKEAEALPRKGLTEARSAGIEGGELAGQRRVGIEGGELANQRRAGIEGGELANQRG